MNKGMAGGRGRIILLLATSLALLLAFGCGGSGTKTVKYHGIRPTDPDGRAGLRNPERGWRIETVFAEADGDDVRGPANHLIGKVSEGYSENWWILDTKQYEEHGLTLAQTYCYLDRFNDRPISQEKLDLLQRSFDNLRKHGLKAVLRFAYEKNMLREGGPELPTILKHLEQLKPLIHKNLDVIYVLQAGLIGAWGEWHSSTHIATNDYAAKAAITAKLLDVLPKSRMTQVRVPRYKHQVITTPLLGDYQVINATNAFSGTPAARIGFHDDSFLVDNTDQGTWREGPFYANPGNPEFDYWTVECPYVSVDGEMDWRDRWGTIDGLRAAVRLRLHHYGSFSIAHSFSEREGNPASIDFWMENPLTIDQVTEAKLPLSDGYFEDGSGRTVPRTEFEYITDHLGYRIELQSAEFSDKVSQGDKLAVKAKLVNRGFAVLYNPRPVYVVLIGEDEKVNEFRMADADPRRWQPYQPGDESYTPLVHEIEGEWTVPSDLAPGNYQIGLWLPDEAKTIRTDPRYAVRVANRDAPWWTNRAGEYGVNVLGEIELLN
ncbi:DUF4832 domain-containing protein [candidate division KSB1 bacterium]